MFQLDRFYLLQPAGLDKGLPIEFNRSELSLLLRADVTRIQIDLNSGVEQATAWGCDLSKKYIEINAEYS